MPLLSRLKNLFQIEEEFIRLDEIAIQRRMAAHLRAAAIMHLQDSQEVVAKSFRGEYLASGLGDYKPFLRQQAKNGEWGTYIEATALAEMTGCTLIVTPVTKGVQQKPICLYRAADPKAPVIELFNSNNTHWYVNSRTLGDGNCLFNAFSQAFQQKVKREKAVAPVAQRPATQETIVLAPKAPAAPIVTPQKPTISLPAPSKMGVFRQTEADLETIKHQQIIAATISQHPTPTQLESDLLKERNRISRLPLAEQKQIEDDHKLALKLAAEEMQYTSRFNVTKMTSRHQALDHGQPSKRSRGF